MPTKLTTRAFIEKARLVHGEKYDYSRVEYVGGKDKVEIICRLHGSFYMRPNNHLANKSGCTKCNKAIGSQEEFINKAKSIFGPVYNYDQTLFSGSAKHITIDCLKHGEFSIIAAEHLRGTGCRICSYEARKKGKRDTTYLERINKRFPDLTLDAQEYQNCYSELGANCTIHGHFKRAASSLLKTGCPRCSIENRITGGYDSKSWAALQKGRKATLYIIEISGNEEFFYK